MPPIEALKLVTSKAVTASNTGMINRKLLFMDISKAYLHAEVLDQDLYVELPKEMELVGQCGRLKRALHGTREAVRCWERESTRKRLNPSSSSGVASLQKQEDTWHQCLAKSDKDDPMDVGGFGQWKGRTGKGKGKIPTGKGKRAGKDGAKPSGQASSPRIQGHCWECGKAGHQWKWRDCWAKPQQHQQNEAQSHSAWKGSKGGGKKGKSKDAWKTCLASTARRRRLHR